MLKSHTCNPTLVESSSSVSFSLLNSFEQCLFLNAGLDSNTCFLLFRPLIIAAAAATPKKRKLLHIVFPSLEVDYKTNFKSFFVYNQLTGVC